MAIVDDDNSACEATIDLVTAMGFTAKGSHSAEDFLESDHLRCTTFLIADMRLPGMNGLELHDHLVRSGKDIPTILMTAFPNDRDRGRVFQTGVVCYLAKPFTDAELLGCIRSGLESRQVGTL